MLPAAKTFAAAKIFFGSLDPMRNRLLLNFCNLPAAKNFFAQ
jgi:hypothetical protein